MIVNVQLKNGLEHVILDQDVFDYFNKHPYYGNIKLLENLRLHSSGRPFFQKTRKKEDGDGFWTETIYIHKLIAETFLRDSYSEENNLVGYINANKLDCRKENLIWRSRSWASRQRKITSKTGYMGVYKEKKRYRAVISHLGKSIHIGMFDTAESAALAYNKKSLELYGKKGKINIIKNQDE